MTKIYKTTLPALLIKNARERGDRTAMREKHHGIWQPFTYKEYLTITSEFAGGLKKLGIGKGDAIVIIGDNRPEWLWAQLAVQGIGGYSVGLYQDAPADEIGYVFTLSEAKLVVAEDQEQVDKIMSIRDELPQLKHIIYHDPKGLVGYKEEGLMSFDEICDMGRDTASDFEKWSKETSPEDIAIIATTSGSTGRPKLAMMSHINLLSMAYNLGISDPKNESDEFVSFLPLAWMGEQMMAVASALLFGFCVNFPEEPDTIQENIREIGPHLIFSPPRVWENMAAKVRVRIMETTPFKRWIFNTLMPIGIKYAEKNLHGEKPSGALALGYKLAEIGLFRAMRDRLGFSRIRSASTGGAPLGPDTFTFFHALGINLKQIYGQTEIAGISCIHKNGEINFDTVGEPISETQIKISDEGEVLSKSPAVFLGYLKNEEATAETLEDGWLKSGDAGYFKDNGQLIIIDRLSDVMELNDGTRFSPQFIENKIKFSTYVQETVVIGRERDYITAIICLDSDIAGRWAEQEQLTYTTYQDLAANPNLYDLIAEEVSSINETLQEGTSIKRFALLFKELDADDGELTRTRKIRRKVIEQRYEDLINALYNGDSMLNLTTRIRYQNGSERTMSGDIAIRELNNPARKV
ncbi:long-chain acyl-CoA synthetase [Maridesulfovibrio ferrireducens]|uniref:Long-chain acyl-CoA synthetase n=1 Tax=Maridesulfovibrio ferrireducens TaxID=246191 RepID=A0A1G9KPC8_9BACT|nr:AMP-binding protein [Maridesulfovibrio ferrireducens]SDL51446.1 long-chain acyl-CoA synthetase [Maridesulfovibrio ferrireducens]